MIILDNSLVETFVDISGGINKSSLAMSTAGSPKSCPEFWIEKNITVQILTLNILLVKFLLFFSGDILYISKVCLVID